MKIPKLPFDLRGIFNGLGGAFSFSRREIIIVSAAVGGVLVTAVVITVIVLAPRVRRPEQAAGFESGALPGQMAPVSERPFLSDFIIYRDKIRESFTGVIYSREPQDSWSEGMIEQYWIDPETVAEDQLETDTEKTIRDIFADVP